MNTHHYDSDDKHNWFLEYENISKCVLKGGLMVEDKRKYRWWDSNPQSLA